MVVSAWRLVLRTDGQAPIEAESWHKWFDLGTWCVAGAAFGALVGAGLLLLFDFYPPDQARSHDEILQVAALAGVFGLPWIVSARIVAEVVFISFAEFIPGADAGLEYQARSSGLFTLAHLGWLIWFGLVLWAPPAEAWIQMHFSGWITASLAAAGGISGAFSVIVGSGSKTTAIIQQASGLRQYLGLNMLAAFAAAIFAIVLVAFVSIVWEWAFAFDPFEHGPDYPSWTFVWVTAAVLAGLIVTALARYQYQSLFTAQHLP
jgi:hypothetical protein